MISALITATSVRNQLAAMRCAFFDIGVLQPAGRMLLRERRSAEQVRSMLKWLRRENALGGHVFVRPHGENALSLLDDLPSSAIEQLKHLGFEPALVVETSPQSFHAWLNHGRILGRELSTRTAKELARRFSGDPSSADWRHFGRLAGFTNQKPARRLSNGYAPFVKLHECSGHVYRMADKFVDEVAELTQPDLATHTAPRPSIAIPEAEYVRSPCTFYHDPRYDGDLHRADLAWAIYAASRGLSDKQIADGILHARDLSKKGRRSRQLDYAKRTAHKAVTLVLTVR